MKGKTTKKLTIGEQLHRHLKLAVIPHKDNQYRPHLVRRYGLIAILLAVIGLQLGYNVTTTGTVLGDQADITTNALLEGTNNARGAQGLGELVIGPETKQSGLFEG